MLFAVCAIAMLLSPVVRYLSAFFSSEPWYLYDDATIAYTAWRSSLGEIPHIDFPYYYAGGYELILGCIFSLFGVSLGTAQWFVVVQMAVTSVLMFAFARRCGLGRAVSFIIAIVWGGGGYLLNLHLFPAWLAQTLVIAALVTFPSVIPVRSWARMLGAGLLLGLASASKQSVGIFALLGFFLVIPILLTEDDPVESENASDKKTGRGRGISPWLLSPVLPFVFFLYVLRNHLTVWNLLFLLAPVLALSGWILWRVAAFARRPRTQMALIGAHARTVILLLVGGYAIGLGMVAGFYAVHGGFWRFFSESFLQVQTEMTRFFSGIEAGNLSLADSPSLVVRRSVVYLILPMFALGGFIASRSHLLQYSGRSVRQSTLLVCSMLAVLNMTLFPNPVRYLLVTVLPLAAIPYAVVVEAVVATSIREALMRHVVVLALIISPIAGYVGIRMITGDLKSFVATNATYLDHDRAQIALPAPIAESIRPVLDYLAMRPAEERLHSYDLYNKAFAFLSGRALVHEYGQLFNFHAQSDDDIRRLSTIVTMERIDILVVGKGYLRGSPAEAELFTSLEPAFSRAVETDSYLIYQKR